MFSSAVRRISAFVSWKVRTSPCRAMRYAGCRVRETPSKDQLPSSGTSKPDTRLKNVVLPAPLGPINAVIVPRWTSRWSTWTARKPPNCRVIVSTVRIGSGFAEPGSGGTLRSTSASTAERASSAAVCSAASRSRISSGSDSGWCDWSADIETQLLLISEDTRRPVHHQHDDPEPDDRQSHGADVGGFEDGGGDDTRRRRLPEECIECRDEEPEDDRADDRSEDPSGAAEDHDGVQIERHLRVVPVRMCRLGVDRQHHTGESDEYPTDHQALELEAVDVLAEAARCLLVFTYRAENPAPGAVHEQVHDQRRKHH